jgi:hypothetical protein
VILEFSSASLFVHYHAWVRRHGVHGSLRQLNTETTQSICDDRPEDEVLWGGQSAELVQILQTSESKIVDVTHIASSETWRELNKGTTTDSCMQ